MWKLIPMEVKKYYGLESLSRGYFRLKSMIGGHFGLETLIIAQFGSGPKPGI